MFVLLSITHGVGRRLAAAFDLIAFLVSIITPVKKSADHWRTVTNMHIKETFREETATYLRYFYSGFAFGSMVFSSVSSFKQQL